jgi:NDP-4-keto-2,6-dideoxyhexose 3-C-methyltransferase
VLDLLLVEEGRGCGDIGAYRSFAGRVSRAIVDLRELVDNARADGKTVYIYAASTRGAVIWQAAESRRGQHRCDGGTAAGEGGPVLLPDRRADHLRGAGPPRTPGLMIVGPWWFRDQFVAREADYLAAGGKLVFPLPRLEIVG